MEKITIDQVSTRIASGTLAFLLFFQSVYPVNAGVVAFQAPRTQITYSPVVKEINNTLSTPEFPGEGQGGPDQPEVQSFTPIGTTDMVDPFTGDFSYNIPLMDVDGYPINMAYSGGVTMDQESSWIGLGWNLNPGVVNRSMRGLPDDFNGQDSVKKNMNLKEHVNLMTNLGSYYPEIFGFSSNQAQDLLGYVSLSYDSYKGLMASIVGLGAQGRIPKKPDSKFFIDLGFYDGQLSVNPTCVLGSKSTMSGGLNFNTSEGLKVSQISASRNFSHKSNSNVANYFSRFSSTFNIPQGMQVTPSISMPRNSYSGKIKFPISGNTFLGMSNFKKIDLDFNIDWLKDKHISVPAYGYLNLNLAQDNDSAMIDFYRENDGAYTKRTPCLPIATLTYDIFSVSGQGISGSYRPLRNEVGTVFDRKTNEIGIKTNVDFEFAMGNVSENGADMKVNSSIVTSGIWNDRFNDAADKLKFEEKNVQFVEANESSMIKDYQHFLDIGAGLPVHFTLQSARKISDTLITNQGARIAPIDFKREISNNRNQLVSTLTNVEIKSGMGIQELNQSAYALNHPEVDHHIGQFTVLNTEGARYVYGIAAYNTIQKDVSFNVGQNALSVATHPHCNNGFVQYVAGADNSVDNKKGIDHFFSEEIKPAYSHSFLLTSVLNADYVDADQIQGPSKGDLGSYLIFDYKKVDEYKWRNPEGYHQANYTEGFQSDIMDDKGHYTYGEKELWYVNEVKSKNHVAVFYTSDRKDAASVNDENGGINLTGAKMQQLDSISLFTSPDYEANGANATSLKTVHFKYSYQLCGNYKNQVNPGDGKLTLDAVYFTFQDSRKGKHSKYVFHYGEKFVNGQVVQVINPDYQMKNVDRWNNYKPSGTCSGDVITDPLRSIDYPYTSLNYADAQNSAIAWNLTSIELPSGATIQIDYESDAYAYVQHKRANNMLRIIAAENCSHIGINPLIETSGAVSISQPTKPNGYLYLELMPDPNNSGLFIEDVTQYLEPGQMVYYKALVNFNLFSVNQNVTNGVDNYDFVPGYAMLSKDMSDFVIVTLPNGQKALRVKFESQSINDIQLPLYNPISVSAVQFARLNLSQCIFPSNSQLTNQTGFVNIIQNTIASALSMSQYLSSPNMYYYNLGMGKKIVLNKSWVRLQNPNKNKFGGGHRVRQIRIYDAWNVMTSNQMPEYYYGQTYEYNQEDGSSSGVASYEPAMGSDENPFKTPISNDMKNFLAPDIRNYQETPFGEQFFPAPIVGYSKVVVKNIRRDDVKKSATGMVVHEFYTAKDFPTIVERTDKDRKPGYIPISAYFFNYYLSRELATQGFVVETNDMHGKQKNQSVYQENNSTPISTVEYYYQMESLSMLDAQPGVNEPNAISYHLINKVPVIYSNGNNGESMKGIVYEAVADSRKFNTKDITAEVQANLTMCSPPSIIVPTIFPSVKYSESNFRSHTFVKVIERFGVLKETIATDLGSKVSTKDLAYDAETGSVLLTQTKTDFNDDVYSFTFPAHWYYTGMGMACINIGVEDSSMNFINGGCGINIGDNKFISGDEVSIYDSINMSYVKGWVVDACATGIQVKLFDGTPLSGANLRLKVLRSGRRNLQNTPIGTVVLRANPLENIHENIFTKVLQASAVEYSDDWKTFCECFLDSTNNSITGNPYVLGNKGIWRPKASYVHLSGRSQTKENNNTNIREDGMFTSFNPFYRYQNNWMIDRQNWTYTSSVVDFSPFGQALETIDALKRYSSSVYGYNQTLPVAVAANSRYRQLGFDGFEDYAFQNCSDNHFRLGNSSLVYNEAHSGHYSVKVSQNDPIELSVVLNNTCEEKECDIETQILTSSNGEGSAVYEITPVGSNAPFTLNYEIIAGAPIVGLTSSGLGLSIQKTTNGSDQIKIIITDQKGCQKIINL
jgi:hypothetical protein